MLLPNGYQHYRARTKTSGKGSINSLEEVDQKGQAAAECDDRQCNPSTREAEAGDC